eukprot:4071891-Prymnesium_polylepis.1
MPIRARLSPTRATAASTVTTCTPRTFGMLKYTSGHVQKRSYTRAPPRACSSSSTAPRRTGLAPMATTVVSDAALLVRRRSRLGLRPADRPA